MSHQDSKVVAVRLNGECLKASLRWLLGGVSWSSVKFRKDCTWTPMLLSAASLLWAWSDESTLGDRFQTARSIIAHIFCVQQELAGTYQAFLKMLQRWTVGMVAVLQTALRERMQERLPDCWEVAGFVMFGVDGSRAELPRTRSHENAYSAARPGKKKKKRKSSRRGKSKSRDASRAKKGNSPQMWLTTMWHVGTGLPWDWRTGPADSSERAHLLEMLPALPAGALITADAGFVGYDYARAIRNSGRHLLIRVGANVKLLQKLGFVRETAGTVYLWPDRAAQKNQPPVVLRLVVANNGKHPVYLVTSVPATQLSDRQVAELYGRRWGIELFYRHLKQTFQRRKLRSAAADNARVEMEWSLVGLWAMALFALCEARSHGTPPAKLSFAGMLRAFRRTMRDYRHPSERGRRLCHRLREAVIDDYVRTNKSSRDYPRKKQESPPGSPVITLATKQQQRQAKALAAVTVQKG